MAHRPPSLARATWYRSRLGGRTLEAAAGIGPDVVYVSGEHAAARCAALEIEEAVAKNVPRLRRALATSRLGADPSLPVARRIAVPGGLTAAAIFDALVERLGRRRQDWELVELFFVDERAVPVDIVESNAWLARERLAEPLGIPPDRVHRMRADDPDPVRAARDYEALLAAPLDLVVLGVGEDGHIASLFPGSPLLNERDRRVAVVEDSPKPPRRRLTLTPRALSEARAILVVADGEAKRAAVERAMAPEGSVEETPARLVRNARWIAGMRPPER